MPDKDMLWGLGTWTVLRLAIIAAVSLAACASPKADYESASAKIRGDEASAIARAEFARADALHACHERPPAEVVPCMQVARYAHAVKVDAIKVQTKASEQAALSAYAHTRAKAGEP